MYFDDIKYLKNGNNRQRQAYSILTNNQVLIKLKQFDPILVGTVPLNIDIENSDLDIICYFEDKEYFQNFIKNKFGNENKFTIRELRSLSSSAIVANFFLNDFEVEIFGQNIPTKQQFAYRHLIVEHKILNKYGEKFRQKIVDLKRQGHKTEPAFALALGLTGDPYKELLKFELNDKIQNHK